MDPNDRLLIRALIFAALFALLLAACSPLTAAPEAGPPVVDEVSATVVLETQQPVVDTPDAGGPAEQPVAGGATQAPETRDPCLAAESQVSYAHPDHGYCLVYPDGFTLYQPAEGVTVIHGPDYSGGSLEPLTGSVSIQMSGAAEGRSASQIADEIVAFQHPSDRALVERRSLELDGVPAVELLYLPGQRFFREIIVVQDGQVYILDFMPMGAEYGQAAADMEYLYEAVLGSFNFLD